MACRGMMAIMSFVTLKGTNITLKESIVIPKLSYPVHMYTKEWDTTHQLDMATHDAPIVS